MSVVAIFIVHHVCKEVCFDTVDESNVIQGHVKAHLL